MASWQLRYRREAIAELSARAIHPFDRVTLMERLRELSRQLLATRGSPPRVGIRADTRPERRQWVYDRLAVEFVILVERKRRWLSPWKVRTARTIEVTFVRVIPGPTPR